MAQYHWDPDGYLAMIREEVPEYERLQDETAAATEADAKRVLELGTGTGETARRVLARNPAAVLIALDASEEMLAHAREALPADGAELRAWGLTVPCRADRSTSSSRRSRSTTSTRPERRISSGASQRRSRRAGDSCSETWSCRRIPRTPSRRSIPATTSRVPCPTSSAGWPPPGCVPASPGRTATSRS